MKRRFASLFAILALGMLLASPAFGQSGSFSLSGQAMGVFSGGAKLVAADAVGTYKLSDTLAARTDNIVISAASSNASLAVADLAGPQAAIPSAAIFKALHLDSTQYGLYAGAEIGSSTSSLGVTNAESAYAGISRHISKDVDMTLFEARYLRAPVPVSNTVTAQNSFIVSLGFTFGK